MPLVRRRRPLLRAVAIVSGAYAAGKRRRQWPTAPAEVRPDVAESPEQLEELFQRDASNGEGAAVAAKKHHDSKQSEQAAAAAPAEAAPAAPGEMTPEVMEKLKQLGELHQQNVLSDEEFEREKAKLLG